MGYMRHHAIIVTTFSLELAGKAHEKAMEIFPIVSEILASKYNGYCSFLIPPDGSKELWLESDEGDKRREIFKKWLLSQLYNDTSSPYSWVEIQYHDDDGETKIIDYDENYYKPEA
jgi:hypothetical protein